MKDNKNFKSILKAIAIVFFVYVILSWIIPGGTFSESAFTKDKTYPLGLLDIITYPVMTIFSSNFAGIPFFMIGIIFLAIGGLYGIMNKTGVYTKIVDNVVSKFDNKKNIFLVISILIFSILGSLTTLSLPIFILVPFMIAVILLLGYNKLTALLSTVGAILVGNMATLYGYNSESLSYFDTLFNNKINDLIIVKIVLFVVSISVLILFVLLNSKQQSKTTKKTKKTEKVEEIIPLYEKEISSKKSSTLMIIIFVVLFLLSLVGMYAWEGAFGVKLFNNISNSIESFKINGHQILANILGTSNRYLGITIGNFSNYDLLIIILIAGFIIGKVYKLTLKEIFDGFVSGAKQMVKVAIVVVLANTLYEITVISYNSGQTMFIASIVNRIIGLSSNMNYFVIALFTAVAAPLFNELPYLVAMLQQPLMSTYENYALLTVIMQSIYGFMMMILPTSVILVAGMSYANISFKEYFKGSWKMLVCLLLAITAVILMFMYIPGIKVM